MELYRARLPFRSVNGNKLAPPVQLPFGLTVLSDGDQYAAVVDVQADSALDALEAARSILTDFLDCMAVRECAFAEVGNPACDVQLANPERVADGPPPPFQVLGGGITPRGAEFFDPTGERRRSRRVLNHWADGWLVLNDVSAQAAWLARRDRWPERIRRALALRRAAECAGDAAVALVLNFAVLEVLCWEDPRKLLMTNLPEKTDRDELVGALRATMLAGGLSAAKAARLVEQVKHANDASPLDTFEAYFTDLGVEIAREHIDWARSQRGAYLHLGDVGPEGEPRRDAFRKAIERALGAELARCPEPETVPEAPRATDAPMPSEL
jgi:hypothetical protein